MKNLSSSWCCHAIPPRRDILYKDVARQNRSFVRAICSMLGELDHDDRSEVLAMLASRLTRSDESPNGKHDRANDPDSS
eukprot:scaffold79528_cov15-Prasinocladus_malaysianus.AAC.1